MKVRNIEMSRRMPALVMAVLLAAACARADSVPAEYRGDWVAEKATCDAAARFRISETQMTLVNGKDSQTYGDIGITYSYFGPDYQGIQVVAMPELNSGNSPFTVYFNADEKKGVTKLDIYTEMKGQLNAQVQAIQTAAKKLSQRFPLDHLPLKKCPSK